MTKVKCTFEETDARRIQTDSAPTQKGEPMSDLIRRDDAIIAVCLSTTRDSATDAIKELPTAKPKEYVKDGTLTVQMPTIKEAKAVDKIVVYSDTYKQEYYMPREWEWCHTCKEYDQERHSCPRMRDVISRTVKELEEQYKPKVGAWIENETTYADNVRQTCECSVCGKISPRPLGDYCRWCGAKMEGASDE